MARFLHISDAGNANHIRRSGLLPSRLRPALRAVFCVPVVPDPAKTYQWARELRGRGARSIVAVFFEIPDDEPVLIGRFGTQHIGVTAAQAHAAFSCTSGPTGQDVLIPRRVEAGEIRKIKAAPRLMGWRFYPEAKGREPFYFRPGTMGTRRRQASRDEREKLFNRERMLRHERICLALDRAEAAAASLAAAEAAAASHGAQPDRAAP